MKSNNLFRLIYLKICLIVLIFSGCTKLTEIPDSAVLTKNYFTNAASAEAAITGAYYWLASNGTQHYIWGYLVDDSRSDDSYSAGNSKEISNVEFFNIVNTDYEPVYRAWQDLYNAIGSCNLVLDNINQINDPSLTTTRKDQINGEAKFLRAFHYFNLVRLFGGVPIVLSTTDANIYKVRSSIIDVYSQIEKDLTDAESALPVSFSGDPEISHSRATQGAAEALLAKVYAQEGKWQQSLNECNKVLPAGFGGNGSGNYDLVSNYDNLFDNQHWGNSETIFEVLHQSGTVIGTFAPGLFIPNDLTDDQTWTKFIAPAHSLINAFKAAGDSIRFHTSITFQNVTTAAHAWPFGVNEIIPFVWKCGRELQGWSSNQNIIFLRLADIILLKAEALNNLNQSEQAIPLVNLIRARVNLAPITVSSQSDVALAILNERRLEMAFEGDRFFSLLRFGGSSYTIQAIKSQTDGFGNPLASYYSLLDVNHLVYPIPQQEIDINNNLLLKFRIRN